MRLKSRRRSRSSSVLLMAAGALAGLAVGVLLADRVGGVDTLLAKSKRKAKVPSRTRPDEVDAGFDTDFDDEPENATHAVASGSAARKSSHTSAISREFSSASGRRASPDEATLEARVLEAFHNDPILRERAIDIGAIGTGVIELTGWVQTRSEIGHAVTLARGVPDVSTVVDRLAVRDLAQRRDTRHAVEVPLADVADSTQPPRAD